MQVAADTFAARFVNPGDDPGISLFALALQAGAFDIHTGAKVLEIGCAEADWIGPALEADPTLHITGIDWRFCHKGNQQRATLIKGDVLTCPFPGEYFDAIVSLSAIEHIGLGHYESDPIEPMGDALVMNAAHHWLKPGGRFYLDVPYTPERFQVLGTECRTYDDAALAERLTDGWHVAWTGYADTDVKTLKPKPTRTPSHGRPYSYVALVLEKR